MNSLKRHGHALLTSFHYFTLVSFVQAEHGPDSQVVLVAVSEEVDIAAIEREVEKQCRELPRDNIASEALSHSYIVVVKDMAEVMLPFELSHSERAHSRSPFGNPCLFLSVLVKNC